MKSKPLVRNYSHRRTLHHSASYHDNLITNRNPWVVAWWSAALPGFGHLMLCKYVTGFILFTWEVFINVNAGINTAIMYSMIGDFAAAKEALDPNWLFFYAGVYVFTIWDSYRRTVDLNSLYVLAYRENSPLAPFKISALEINYLNKRNPLVTVLFSAIIPGLGYLYINRLPSAFVTLTWWIVIVFFSKFHEALLYTMVGNFSQAAFILDPQWFLFMPSLYVFAIYDSYSYTVELNKVFEKEQANFLLKHYQANTSEVLSSLNEL